MSETTKSDSTAAPAKRKRVSKAAPGAVRIVAETAAKRPLPRISPQLPPETAEEIEESRRLTAKLEKVARDLRQSNLDRAVMLAQQAARGQGQLVDHFAELGRRFGHLLAPQKPKLRVIDGGTP